MASATTAQPSTRDERRLIDPDCGSVVIVKCDRPLESNAAADAARQQARRTEVRRQSPLIQLDGVVIEDEAIRRRSVEETIGAAFPAFRPRDGDHSFVTGEGTQCTCNNNCPPWPLPCCVCSSHMSRYRLMPGSSPTN